MEPLDYRAVVEAAPDGILLVDADGRIRELNPRAEEMFGYDREELLGEEVERLVPGASREAHRRERREYVRDPEPRPMGIGMELRGVRSDGREFPVEISLSPLRRDDGLLVVATVRDVSQRTRLRDFGAGALRAAEEERRRISRELHDDVAQRVATLLIRLRIAERETDRDGQAELIRELRDELVECSEAIRRIARGLRPPALGDAGVATAIRSHVRERTDDSGLQVELEGEPVDALLDDEGKLVLYRVVQEALSNVLRHAGASRARITLTRSDGHVVAEVEDDGRGFDLEGPVEALNGGLGLVGMKERAHIVGGKLEIDTEPGRGTRVRVRIPGRPRGAAS